MAIYHNSDKTIKNKPLFFNMLWNFRLGIMLASIDLKVRLLIDTSVGQNHVTLWRIRRSLTGNADTKFRVRHDFPEYHQYEYGRLQGGQYQVHHGIGFDI